MLALNSRGNAMIEVLPILVIVILLVNFSLGAFGLIHSGILNSIAARNYTFETFRNRADLRYLRDIAGGGENDTFTFTIAKLRYHSVVEGGTINQFVATRRPMKFSDITEVANPLGASDHLKTSKIKAGQAASDFVSEGVTPAWIRTAYGICLETSCGR